MLCHHMIICVRIIAKFIVFQDKILKLDLKVLTSENNAANLHILTYLQAVLFLRPA